jgi:ribonuclease E
MLINTLEGHECRIAIVDGGRLQELYVERSSSASHVGNIYKGKITNVEAAIQAVFVDFGLGKNGFLHISDVHPQYFPKGQNGDESVGRKRPRRQRPPIQECFKRGQEVVVQMTKEGIGTKGPTMTTYLSIPGRMLVMMPGLSRLGVSRKIEDDEARTKAKAALEELKLPENMGFIVRTAGIDRPKRELQRDLNYLTRLWKNVNRQIGDAKAPAEIYKESDLVVRTLRDIYNSEIKRIICDSPDDARKVQAFLAMAVPRSKDIVEAYTGTKGLFADYGLEHEIERMYFRRVDLPSGGSLVIDQAEALVAIDINSGKFREHSDAETTAVKTDLEAAEEIARQLRIRDLGGVIVIDFIDLLEEKHRRQVERVLREAIKPDRAKTKILRMSQFGIVEMTRQRMRPSLKESIYRMCAHCEGAGVIKSEESQSIAILRTLQHLCVNEEIARIEVAVPADVADHLNNVHRKHVMDLETDSGRSVSVRAEPGKAASDVTITCWNQRGSTVAWDSDSRKPRGEKGGRGKAAKAKAAKIKVSTIPASELPPLPAGTEEDAVHEGAAAEAGAETKTPAKEAAEAPAKKPRRRRKKAKAVTKPGAPDKQAGDDGDQKADEKAGKKTDKKAEKKSTKKAGRKSQPRPAAEGRPAGEKGKEEAKPAKPRRRGRRGGKKHRRKDSDSGEETSPPDREAKSSASALVEPPAPETSVEPFEDGPAGGGAAEGLLPDWPFADEVRGDID